MAVSLQFPSARALDLVGFAWSPLFESVLSMRVVTHPKRTPMHLPWARRARELPPALFDEIQRLARDFDRFIPAVFEVGLRGNSPAFADELAAFRALDEDLVAYELSLLFGGPSCMPADDEGAHRVHEASYRAEVLAAASGDPRREDLARAVFDDPSAVRERYARLLESYWEAAFREEWERILPRVENEVTAAAHRLVTGGIPGLVREFLPEGRWDDASSTIHVQKDWDGTRDVAARGPLQFVPTVYGWPCVLIELARPWPLAVIFPLRELRNPAVPPATDSEVASGFRALGDETRLQIARLVAEDPRSTKELAELLSLSDSAISRHLKILAAAGLVTSERDGYFVLYRFDADRLDVLARAGRNTLGLGQVPTGEVPALQVAVGRERPSG